MSIDSEPNNSVVKKFKAMTNVNNQKNKLIAQIITYGGDPENYGQHNKSIRKALISIEKKKKL